MPAGLWRDKGLWERGYSLSEKKKPTFFIETGISHNMYFQKMFEYGRI